MDRRTLEAAATDNSYLRGLLLVPLSLLFFLAALGNASIGPLRHSSVFIAGVAVIGAAYLLVSRYYNETYGRVTQSPRQQNKAARVAFISVALVLSVSTLLRSQAAWSLDLPVNPIAAALALVFMINFATTVGIKRHHVVILGSLAIAGLLPVWHGRDPSNIGLVMAGAAIFVIGILDHVILARTFGPMPAGENNAGA